MRLSINSFRVYGHLYVARASTDNWREIYIGSLSGCLVMTRVQVARVLLISRLISGQTNRAPLCQDAAQVRCTCTNWLYAIPDSSGLLNKEFLL